MFFIGRICLVYHNINTGHAPPVYDLPSRNCPPALACINLACSTQNPLTATALPSSSYKKTPVTPYFATTVGCPTPDALPTDHYGKQMIANMKAAQDTNIISRNQEIISCIYC